MAASAAGRFGSCGERLRGILLLPGDPGYVVSSQAANARFDDIKPLAIAKCVDEADVVTCVKWSRAHGIHPVARGGGHSYAGFSSTEGLIIDVGNLNQVILNQHTGMAVMGGAAKNQNVLNATVFGDWVLPGGTCLGVGIGGLVLGGGIGYNTHWAGLTSDHLVGLTNRHRRWPGARDRRAPALRSVLGLPRRGGGQLRDQHAVEVPAAPDSAPRRRLLPLRLARG